MKVQDKVSIVIPIYNVEKYISRCLESVLEQSYPDIEIICVDDCGTDNSMSLVKKYAQDYPGRIVIETNSENKGLGGARDAGIKASTGDYLMFVDSDDYIDKIYVEKYIEAIRESDVDIVIGGYIRDRGNVSKTIMPGKTRNDIWMFCPAWAKLYRKEFLITNHVDFRGIRRYEDELFLYRMLLNGAGLTVIDYAGYHYYLNTESITQNRNIDRTDLFVEYVTNLNSFCKEVGDKICPEDKEIFVYSLMARLTACLLFNARGCGAERMGKLYEMYDEMMCNIAGKRIKNHNITFIKRIQAEDVKVHYAMWLVTQFRRIKMDKILFTLDSYL